jgi:L-2-hydroxyglutarate oxidase LhgO
VACQGALHLPTSGIIDATALVYKLYALASGSGAQFMTRTELKTVRQTQEGLELEIEYRDGLRDRFLTGRLINSAGLHCDEVALMADPGSVYRVDPVRSEAMKFYCSKRPELLLKGHNVYPTPESIETPSGSYFTVGVHLTPTLETGAGGAPDIGSVVTVGPLNQPARDKYDVGGDFRPAARFLERVGGFFPGLREDDLEPHQVGVQARLAHQKDWVIEFCPSEPRCLNLLGIDSPGLTGSLAIARHIAAMLDG